VLVVAEQAGDRTPHRMQRLLGEAVWDVDGYATTQGMEAESRAIANFDLQLLAHVRYAPAIEWHQPT
jgi:hypothetical protein